MRVSVLFPFLPTGPRVPTGLVGPAGLMVSEPWEQALPHLGQGTALGPERDQSGCGEGVAHEACRHTASRPSRRAPTVSGCAKCRPVSQARTGGPDRGGD